MTEHRFHEAGTIRASYEEYELEGANVAMITDPENVHAWIQSDVTRSVDR